MNWRRHALALFLAVVVLVLAVVAWLWAASRFQDTGEMRVAGLGNAVEVLRDRRGIPYVFADDVRDAYVAQGFITAQHRLFQMELYRRLIAGRLAEVIGEVALHSDVMQRLLDPLGNAREHWQRLQPADRIALQAYADGVNAYVRDFRHEHHLELRLLGIRAEPWEPEELLAIAHYVASTQSQSFHSALVLQRVLDRIGPLRTAELFPELPSQPRDQTPSVQPYPAARPLPDDPWRIAPAAPAPGLGSNAWALAGERNADGGAVLGNDPHLDARVLPGIWHPIGLYTADVQALGAAVPGLPGLLVGRNRDIAFGVTNAYGDTQDLFLEQPDPGNPDRYLDGDRSLPFREREEWIRIADPDATGGYRTHQLRIRSTRRGVMVSDHPPANRTGVPLSLAWTAAEPRGQGSRLGFDRLWQAGSERELLRIAADIRLLTMNLVYADADGNVGFRATGHVPVRPGGNGSLPRPVQGGDHWAAPIPAVWMPGERNPARGWVAAANHDTRPVYFPFYYSSFFGPEYRYRRLAQLLDRGESLDRREQWGIMLDTYNTQAETLRPRFVEALDGLVQRRQGDALLRSARDTLATWDLHDRADEAAPLIYHQMYREFSRLAFRDVLGPGLAREYLALTYLWKMPLDAMVRDQRLDAWRGPDLPGTESILEEAAERALDSLRDRHGDSVADWAWGDVHRITFTSPLRPSGMGRDLFGGGEHPADGSGETMLRAAHSWHGSFDVRLHDSMRFLADMGQSERVLASLAGGVVGRQFHVHFRDQLDGWLAGEAETWWFDEEAVRRHARRQVVLLPVSDSGDGRY